MALVFDTGKWDGLIQAVKTAKEWGIPPISFLNGSDKREWSMEDSVLAMGLRIYEDTMICSCCGFPTRLAHDSDNDGWFEVDSDTICYAGQARDEWEKQAEKTSREPGAMPHVIYTR